MQNKAEKSRKVPKRGRKCHRVENCWYFWHFFWQNIQILFVAVNHCNKQFFCLSQWFSATNKISVCHSDSVRRTILTTFFYLLVACDKTIVKKKAKNKHHSKFEFHQRYQIALGYLTRISVLWTPPFVMLRRPPMYSETEWTVELWSNLILLIMWN